MRFAFRRSLVVLALGTSTALPALAVGSCGGGGGSGSGAAATTTGTGAGGSTGVVLVGSGGGVSSADCGGPPATDAALDGPTGCEGLDGGASYDAVGPLFLSCASETCHSAPWTQPTLVNIPAYECCDGRFLVQPGNANRSYLLDKLVGHDLLTGGDLCQGPRMPANGPPYMADANIELVRRWICEGAPAQ